jgi:hypothetical protein
MYFVPVYRYRNRNNVYHGTKLEIKNVPTDKMVHAARYTLGSQDHVFKIGGKLSKYQIYSNAVRMR